MKVHLIGILILLFHFFVGPSLVDTSGTSKLFILQALDTALLFTDVFGGHDRIKKYISAWETNISETDFIIIQEQKGVYFILNGLQILK